MNLAQEPDFTLGGIDLSPSRGLVSDGATAQRVTPQVMQALLVLARAEGRTLTRDEMVDACWDGRIVSDDAINRVIALLRGLARRFDPPPFHLHTIPKVGFRLEAAEPHDAGAPAAAAVTAPIDDPTADWLARPIELASPAAHRTRPILSLAAFVLLVLALGLAAFAWRRSATPEPEPRIALTAFSPLGADAQDRMFAKRLTDEVAGVLNENVAGLAPPEPGLSPAPADLLVGGSALREGDILRVRAYLENGHDKLTLWSRQYERPVAEEDALRIQVAVDVSETLLSAMEPLQQKGLRIDSRALALWLFATGVYRQGKMLGDPRISARAYEEVVERAPQFARARGMMAQGYAIASLGAPPPEAAQLRRRARVEAEQALRDDPLTAEGAYDALFYLARGEAPSDYARAEDIWSRGLARAPNLVGGLMRRCEFLLDLGRAQAALPGCERAAALRPLGAPWGYRYARALAATGQAEKADEIIAREVRLHPQQPWIRQTRFQMKAFGGSPAEAQALLHDHSQPPAFTAEQSEALEAFLRARVSRAPADADRAAAKLHALVERHALGREYLFKALVALDRLDEAFATAAPAPADLGSAQGWLFEPGMRPAQRDPRFWDLAARLGLLRYWRIRGVWPDFCNEPDLGFDCATRAAKVTQTSAS